jgi:hypothetical protein
MYCCFFAAVASSLLLPSPLPRSSCPHLLHRRLATLPSRYSRPLPARPFLCVARAARVPFLVCGTCGTFCTCAACRVPQALTATLPRSGEPIEACHFQAAADIYGRCTGACAVSRGTNSNKPYVFRGAPVPCP